MEPLPVVSMMLTMTLSLSQKRGTIEPTAILNRCRPPPLISNALPRQYRTGSGEYPDVTVFIRMLRFAKPCNWVAVRINFSTMVTCTSIIVMSILKMKIDY